MWKYYIHGKGDVSLSDRDFKGQGGQALIYARGSTAYKIYSDRGSVIRPEKIAELSVLDAPNIIRPLDLLMDLNGNPAGYSMRYIDGGYVLCQLFPATFRNRHNLTADGALQLVRKLQTGVAYVHSKGILIVDLNEMNFLVSSDLREVYFLDVDSYQTPSFPANAIMDSVRDRHAATFSEATDWFAFAIVSFQLFVGVHPYKGTYPPFLGSVDKSLMLDERMKTNISVLRAGVLLPAACRPFTVIPSAYLSWYRKIFESGERPPPPGGPVDRVAVQTLRTAAFVDPAGFHISLLLEFDSDIVDRFSDVTLTRKSVYIGSRKYDRPGDNIKLALTPRSGLPVGVSLDGDLVRFVDLRSGNEIGSDIKAEDVMVTDGRAYLKRECELMQVEFVELSSRIVAIPRAVGQVLKNATQLFDGVVFQNLVGAWYASLLPEPFTCYQTRIAELDGNQLVNASSVRNVLIVVGIKSGRYDRLIFRFDRSFTSYDVRTSSDVDDTAINFTVLDSGVCLFLTGEGLELFSSRSGDSALNLLPAPDLGDATLFHYGSQALLAKGNKLFRFSLKPILERSVESRSPLR